MPLRTRRAQNVLASLESLDVSNNQRTVVLLGFILDELVAARKQPVSQPIPDRLLSRRKKNR